MAGQATQYIERFDSRDLLGLSLRRCRCNQCLYMLEDGRHCLAFPAGIPQEILSGQHAHRHEYRGDHGFQFHKQYPISRP